MDNIQGLYYAFGQLAYAVAAADGAIQQVERTALHKLLVEKFNNHNIDFDYSEIIFQILAKDHTKVNTAYEWAMREMKLNEYYLTEKKKKDFVDILQQIASAKTPVTIDEKNIIDKFREDIAPLKGDPVFTGEK
ncbi:MAG: hypothetical protein JNL63_09275 [Bacteroidia bacterium]|nr:hypothetical protein [Bacteroidia bacterium]